MSSVKLRCVVRVQCLLSLLLLVLCLGSLAPASATAGVKRSEEALEVVNQVGNRRLLSDKRTVNGNVLFTHVPFLTCAIEKAVVPSGAPFYTQTSAECAALCDDNFWHANSTIAGISRIDAHNDSSNNDEPVCTAFKYARVDSASVGGFRRCVLLHRVASCSVNIVGSPYLANAVGVWEASASLVWDYHFRMYLQAFDATLPTSRGSMNITGLPVQAAGLVVSFSATSVSYAGVGNQVISAIYTALSTGCCATNVRLVNVTDISSTTVGVQIEISAAWVTDEDPAVGKYLDLVLNDANGEAALLAAFQRSFPTVTAVTYAALTHTGLGNADRGAVAVAEASMRRDSAFKSAVIGITVVLAVVLVAVMLHAGVRRMRDDAQGSRRGGAASPDELAVFVSYRRDDLALADTVVDQLHLAGLRVFYDRGGEMAGRPFEEQLHRVIRQSRVTSVIVTLELMRSLAAHRPDSIDWLLAELLLSMHYQLKRPGRHIFPLLVGPPIEKEAGVPQRCYLLTDAAFVGFRDALPDVVPAATLALVSRMLLRDEGSGSTLDVRLQGITVRQLILGRPDGTAGGMSFTGLLSISSVSVHGPDDYLPLVLRHRYADRILQALQTKSESV